MVSPLAGRHRSESWICVCVAFFLLGGHLQLAEGFNWTHLPPDPLRVFTGSTVSLTWSYEKEGSSETLTYIELTRKKDGQRPVDIGEINAKGAINVIPPYNGYMGLEARNQSAILTIDEITKSDDFKYCCKLGTSRMREEKCTHLEVLGHFNWTELPPNVTQKITGSVVFLRWSYDFGKDANLTSIEFRRESDGVDSSDIGSINQDGTVNVIGEYKGRVDLTAVNNSAVLTINRIKTTDDAEYCCKLKTTKGNVEKCARLKVLDPPTVSVSSEPVVVVEGKSVTLVCNTTGIPEPYIEWTKSDESGTVLSNTSTLTLQNVKRPGNANNAMKYQCSASNGIGSPANAAVSVVVYYDCSPSPPRRTATEKNKRILEDWQVIAIAVLSTLVLIVLIAAIIHCCCLKKRKKRRNEGSIPASEDFCSNWVDLPQAKLPAGQLYGYQNPGMSDVDAAAHGRHQETSLSTPGK